MVFLDVWEKKLQSESWTAKGPNIRNGSRITRSYPLGLTQKQGGPGLPDATHIQFWRAVGRQGADEKWARSEDDVLVT